ncbi:MAG TPA: hypothetical protein VMR45_02055 [Patescibacteria group bacterium]|nr:hypothetical protein [Patescibacteria group bacterium]
MYKANVSGFGSSNMFVKIKVVPSRASRVPVVVRRPSWQEFLNY